MGNEEYIDEYIEDSKEQLENLSSSILVLEKNDSDEDAIGKIFRAAHTLKGNSATMGFMKVKELMHNLENVFDDVRNNKIKVSPDLIDLVFECTDQVESMVDSIASGGDEGDVSRNPALVERLRKMIDSKEKKGKEKGNSKETGTESAPEDTNGFFNLGEDAKGKIAEAKDNVFNAKIVLTEDCIFGGVRAQLVMSALSSNAEIIGTHPDAKELEEGNFGKEFNLLLITAKEEDEIKKEILSVAEIKDVVVQKAESVEAESSLGKTEEKSPHKGEAKTNIETVQSIRVSITKLDALMNLAGELVLAKIGLDELKKKYSIPELEKIVSNLDKLVIELQDEVIDARMVPVKHVFDKFPRMIRDLARKQDKQVNFVVEGEEITLDRTVLDKIGDPLVHLLRNAVDHGVENVADRKKCNKKPTGTVKLIARKEKSMCVIEISDNGGGMDAEVLKQTAVKKGLKTEEEVKSMTDQEAFGLIFLPGFSTTEVITDISGRGVGMDVVQSTMQSLGGTYTIKSEKDKGTSVVLKIPLSLAIIQSLLIRIGTEKYALPMSTVNNIISLKKSNIKKIQNEEVIIYRNSDLPVYWLKRIFNFEDEQSEEEDKNSKEKEYSLLVVEKGEEEIGIIIDEVLGEQYIIIKPLNDIVKKVKGFSGVTILGDGKVIFILDVGNLV